MKVTKKKLDDGKLLIEATANAAEVNRVLQAAHFAFANQMGLRPEKGKTVAQVAEEQMGIKNLDSIVEATAINALVPLALDEKNILAAWTPTPKAKTPFKRNQEFKFSMEVTPKPEYELTSYEPVELTVPEFRIPEDAVQMQLDSIAQNFTAYLTDDSEEAKTRTIEPGDHIRLAMKATEDGKEIKGLTTDGRTYAVGQGYMPDGFDRAIIGMKVGETKQFEFDGPGIDENGKERTQKVQAEVTILEMLKETVPEITDEWVAANMPMYKSAEAMRTDVERMVEMQMRQQYDVALRQSAVEQLAGRFEGHIENEMYEHMRDNIMRSMQAQLKQQGKTWEEFVVESGGAEQVNMLLLLQAREMLVQGFALDALFRHEKMQLTEEDIDATCAQLNPQQTPEQTRKQFQEQGNRAVLRESAERYKANRWLVETANITFTKPGENDEVAEKTETAEVAEADASA